MTDKPNVLFVFTDQQRWDSVGLHGGPGGLTPHFDRLAREGTFLKNCFTPNPVCGPARSCLQTGLHSTHTGVYRNGGVLRSELPNLAGSFNAAGYATGYIGKWHLASSDPVPPEERAGYQYWLGANTLEHSSDAYDCVVYDGEGKPERLPGYRVDALTDAAIRYIDGHREEPFFLFLSYLEPHQQNHVDSFVAPAGYRELHEGLPLPADLAALGGNAAQEMAGYRGMARRIDECLGRMTDALQSLGLLDTTIIAFASDHGCHFKTRGGAYKQSCHDSSIRVPAFLRGPGFMTGGERREIFSLIDFMPTLLEACGLPVVEGMHGRSLLPRLSGRGVEWPEETLIQFTGGDTFRALRDERWTYCVTAEGCRQAASESYVETHLYDNQMDPHQLSNLVGYASHRQVADELKERLLRRIEAAEGGRPQIENAAEKAAGQRKPPRRVEELGDGDPRAY